MAVELISTNEFGIGLLVGLEGMPLGEAANNLLAEAAARVSGRLAPGQDPAAMSERALNFLGADPT